MSTTTAADAGSTTLQEGRRVGQWTLDQPLGEGGAGSVWSASNERGERAAIKVMHEGLAHDERVRSRFAREAELAERIAHPGLARVIERGETDDGLPYIALELLRGETIEARRVRKGGRLPVNEVLWIVDRTLAALSALHAEGIVHRDVKPENIFFTEGGELKLLDLGIARVAAGPMTHAGALLGTVAFMAPEQARGDVDDVDLQTDLWCVGSTMYILLSGQFIRDAADVRSLLMAAATREVASLRTVAPDLPGELIDLVDYVLSLDKKRRWPSAAAMRRAVRMVYSSLGRSGKRSRSSFAEDDEVSFDPSAVQEMPPPVPVASSRREHDIAPRSSHDSARPKALPTAPTVAVEEVAVPVRAPAPSGAGAARARERFLFGIIALLVLLLVVAIALLAARR